MPDPGAPMSIVVAPKFENELIAPVLVIEATLMTLALAYSAGKQFDEVSQSAELLPAAATNRMPCWLARSIASARPCEKPPPPQELLVATMFRPWRVLRSVK
jgi:hypothetical protein